MTKYTIYDDFNDNYFDRTKWTVISGEDQIHERNQRLEFEYVPPSIPCIIKSTKTFWLKVLGGYPTADGFSVKVINPGYATSLAILSELNDGYVIGINYLGNVGVIALIRGTPEVVKEVSFGRTSVVLAIKYDEKTDLITFYADNTKIYEEKVRFEPTSFNSVRIEVVAATDEARRLAIIDDVAYDAYQPSPVVVMIQYFQQLLPTILMLMMMFLLISVVASFIRIS